MGRYKIHLTSGQTLQADDAWQEGDFVGYITRYDHDTYHINAREVSWVEKVDLGFQGGMRRTGHHDTSFRRTPGSF